MKKAKSSAIAECEKCDLLNAIVYNNVDFEIQIGIRDARCYETLGEADFTVYGSNYYKDLSRKLSEEYDISKIILNWKKQAELFSKETLFL